MPASIVDLDDPAQPPTSGAITLLLVEDEVIVAEDVKKRLENLGYKVLGIATRGSEAIAMAASLRPGLVLMDIGLRGGMDGIETVHRIREKVDVPVIFASAYSDDMTLERAREAAPQGFVLKPFEERELRTAIEMAIQKHAAEKLLRRNENLLRTVFEFLPDAVYVENANHQVELANDAFYRMFKIPASAGVKSLDARQAGSHVANPFASGGIFHERAEAIVRKGVPLVDEPWTATDGKRLLVNYMPIDGVRGQRIHLWQIHETVSVAGSR